MCSFGIWFNLVLILLLVVLVLISFLFYFFISLFTYFCCCCFLLYFGYDLSYKLSFSTGAHRITQTTSVQEELNLKALYHHSEFANLKNDIALLQLERPVQLSDKVMPACLPTSRPAPGQACYITGKTLLISCNTDFLKYQSYHLSYNWKYIVQFLTVFLNKPCRAY